MTEPDEDEASAVTVALRPAEQSIPVDEQTTFEVVVEGAGRGVAAYETAVQLDGGARMAHLELTGEPAVPVADIVDDDTGAVMAAAMGPDSDHEAADEVVIAVLTVAGETAGESVELSVDDATEVAPISDGIERYTVDGVQGGTLRVVGNDGSDDSEE